MRLLGAYVHFPWCLRKCPYCDFASFEKTREAIDGRRYADAVLCEIEARREALEAPSPPLASIFFGGGTPSLWHPSELGRVLRRLRRHAVPEVEITVECNPSSLDLEGARALVEAGANRLSVGVQGLDAERLRFLGRLHDAAEALAALDAALESGARVSADLIYGVATHEHAQRPEEAAAEARRVAATGVEHVSAYQLTVEPNTRFGELGRARRLPLLAEQAMAETFLAVAAALEEAGLQQYEISNFARPGCESRHNLGYWLGHDYLGLGSAAYGTLTLPADGRRARRYRNAPNPERYLALAAEGRFEPHEQELLEPETRLRERLMLGLRLAEGLDLEAAAAELGVDPWPRARRRAAGDLCAAGQLLVDGPRVRIPRGAWLFADAIAARLF